MVLPGSITERRTRCGRPNCGCHADPPRLHGPYWQWTRKVAAKTVCRWLSADQRRDYTAWIDNDRRLCANCSPGSKPSAPPPSKPTPAGTARHPPGPPGQNRNTDLQTWARPLNLWAALQPGPVSPGQP